MLEPTVEFRNGHLEVIYPIGYKKPVVEHRKFKKHRRFISKSRKYGKSKKRKSRYLVSPELESHLHRFWTLHPLTQTDRIKLLVEFAGIKLPKHIGHYYRVRKDFEKFKSDILPFRDNSQCFCCGGPPDIRHHIILVLNGGDNRRENLLFLCESCHAEIHPWLKSVAS